MAMRNVHEKFASGTTFLNVGLTIGSAALLVRSFADSSYGGEAAAVDPSIAFGISAVLCMLGLISSKSEKQVFNFYRDGLPPLAFSTCLILAGVRENITWLLLAASIVANIFFIYAAGRHDVYDEDRDRIAVYFRWPF